MLEDSATGAGGTVDIRRPTGDFDPLASLPAEVGSSLAASPRWLPSKFHYDATGSEVFEEITRLPEYYPTRTELGILRRIAEPLVDTAQPRAVVEYGSGSASKTQAIMDAMQHAGVLDGYGAIEVSESALRGSAERLLARYPKMRFEGVVADFESDVALPFEGLPRLILFLGSTIGNLVRDEAVNFLDMVRKRMTPRDHLLIGFDLVKDVDILEAAYNDSAGVTEQFTLNLLRVVNRELGADFDTSGFRHLAEFNQDAARIEAHAVAQRDMSVSIPSIDLAFNLKAGERIRTEYSHKYTRESVEQLLAEAGLSLESWWTDEDDYFAVVLTRPRD